MDPKVLRSDQADSLLQVITSASTSCWSLWKSQKTIEHAAVTTIDETIPFEVETDASEVALAATINQNGRPVSFFSRTI